MRNFIALAALAMAGASFVLPEPAVAGMRGGALPGFRAPVFAPRAGRMFRPVHRPSAPRAVFGARPLPPLGPRQVKFPPSARGFATTTPFRPFAHLTRRHHRAYHSGWDFPVTVDGGYGYGGGYGYIGTPYDPAELIPVYGPAPAADEVQPAPPRASAVRDGNVDACRSERVTVPAAEGEREITVVRC